MPSSHDRDSSVPDSLCARSGFDVSGYPCSPLPRWLYFRVNGLVSRMRLTGILGPRCSVVNRKVRLSPASGVVGTAVTPIPAFLAGVVMGGAIGRPEVVRPTVGRDAQHHDLDAGQAVLQARFDL